MQSQLQQWYINMVYIEEKNDEIETLMQTKVVKIRERDAVERDIEALENRINMQNGGSSSKK